MDFDMADITVIILTYNEERHIRRSIQSAQRIASRIVVLDSFSTDRTKNICEELSVDFYQNKFKNYATQFNFALDNTDIDTEWIMRLDADEYLDNDLVISIERQLSGNQTEDGFLVNRVMSFMGKIMKFGGSSRYYMLRLWRNGLGRCEQRWMDEHIIMKSQRITKLSGRLIDENTRSIHWWIEKHNNYSAREAVDIILDNKFGHSMDGNAGQANNLRRRMKQIYLRFPIDFRAFLYFLYRYFILLGFLDGRAGFVWCFLQGWWYRTLVDLKVREIQNYTNQETGSPSVDQYVKDNYQLEITPNEFDTRK